MLEDKKKSGKIAQIVLIIWNIAEYTLLFGLLALVGILSDLPFWYYPLAATVMICIIMFLRHIKKSVKKDKIEKLEMKDYSKGDKR